MPSGAVRLPGRCGGDGRGGRCRHRRAVMDGRAPPTRQPERGWASPAPVPMAVEDVRTPDTPLVACPRPLSAGRTSVHWGGADVRCPRDRRDPGVRTDTPPVTVAPASALSAPRWILACVGAAGPPTSGRIGFDVSLWSASGWVVAARIGPGGEGMVVRWQCVARTRVDGRPGPPQRMRTGWGRRVRRLADQGSWSSARVPVGGAGNTRRSRCSQVPRLCVLSKLPA